MKIANPMPVTETKLDLLAARANEAHGRTVASLRKAIHHAKEAGDALRAAKLRVGHFNWLTWLKANFDASAETARVYMRISMYWDTQLLPAMEKDEGLTNEKARQILRRPTRTSNADIENSAVPLTKPEADLMKDELTRYFKKWLADMPEIGMFCLYSIWDKVMRDVLDEVMVEMEKCRLKDEDVCQAGTKTVADYRIANAQHQPDAPRAIPIRYGA